MLIDTVIQPTGKAASRNQCANPHHDIPPIVTCVASQVVKRDEAETRPDDADQQNDAFDARNDEPLRDVLPRDDFWDHEASGRCPPVKPQKAGLLSKLSTLFWRPKSQQCAQERLRAPSETVSTARPTKRVIVLPPKKGRRDRRRSRTDRHCTVTSTADEGEHSSQPGNRQPAGHQSSVDTSLCRVGGSSFHLHFFKFLKYLQHGTATSATDTRDGQTSDSEHDGGCFMCRSKRELSYFYYFSSLLTARSSVPIFRYR
ncbi:hypothetical protein EDC04DRAFT_2744295 [Pisolithus marmoratus]|nr:hypothetical protein EDC04DRAFT_2744295 [Pisolithus marmoratus]